MFIGRYVAAIKYCTICIYLVNMALRGRIYKIATTALDKDEMDSPAPLKKILLIEDDPDIREIACLALESTQNFSVDVCSSGLEALERAASLSPQLVLLDVMMPGMDGPTTLKKLRLQPNFADVPVIFLTAKVRPHEIENYRQLGALEVITKPFDPLTLADALLEVWNRHNGS